MLNTNYLIIFAINYYISLWCQNKVCDVTRWICDDSTFSFKEPHAIDVLNGYSASTNSGDLESEWWGVRANDI